MVEADETFFLESFKGPRSGIPTWLRSPHLRVLQQAKVLSRSQEWKGYIEKRQTRIAEGCMIRISEYVQC